MNESVNEGAMGEASWICCSDLAIQLGREAAMIFNRESREFTRMGTKAEGVTAPKGRRHRSPG